MFYQARDIDNYNSVIRREIIEDILLLPLMFLLFCYVKCIGYSMHFKNYTELAVVRNWTQKLWHSFKNSM